MIPPPVVALCAGALMWLVSLVVAPMEVPTLWRMGAAFSLAAIGFCFDLAGVLHFVRARTTINPRKPAAASSLVSAGVYRLTRNPMYLGLLFILLGWAAFLSNVAALLVTPLFVLYINRFQIVPEERILAAKFGAQFAAYKASAHRWL